MRPARQVDSPVAPAPRPGAVAARLRARYARQVAALGYEPQSLAGAVGHLALHVGLAAGAAFGTHIMMRASPLAGWALYPLAAFFIATRFRALGNMLHEACHGILVRGKRRNRALGHLLAIIDLTALEPYTREHFTHHVHLGHPEKDLDFVPRRRFGFAEPPRSFLRTHLLRPLALFHLPAFLRPVFFHREDPAWVSVLRAGFLVGLVALAHLGIGWTAFVLFYAVPYLVPYQVIRYWSDAVDHAGIIGSEDEFHRSRNHVVPWAPLGPLLFPRHDGYHLTHHLFPAVPTAFQGRVHALLLEDPDYAAREHSLTALLR
jgi:fatty acid desaturase